HGWFSSRVNKLGCTALLPCCLESQHDGARLAIEVLPAYAADLFVKLLVQQIVYRQSRAACLVELVADLAIQDGVAAAVDTDAAAFGMEAADGAQAGGDAPAIKQALAPCPFDPRSEERRVGKECRARWS